MQKLTFTLLALLLGLLGAQPVSAACPCSTTTITNLKNANKINISADCSTITFKSNTDIETNGGATDGHFYVPSCINTIVINAGVTVTGNFISTTSGGTLTIKGKNRQTSKIRGNHWNDANFSRGPQDLEVFTAIFSKLRVLVVQDLTSNYPDKYHILGRKKVTARRLDVISIPNSTNADPSSNWHTTDGIGGSTGSIVSDCIINTFDDAIKIYAGNMSVTNVTITWNKNGAPLQMGWGGGSFYQSGSATVSGLTVINNSTSHNQGIISWASGSFPANTPGTRTLTFTGTNTIPNVSNVVQIGACCLVNNVILNLKGTYVCNNKAKMDNVFFKNAGSNCTVRSQGCSPNFTKNSGSPRLANPDFEESSDDEVSQLRVYPNPATTHLLIKGLEEGETYEVFNMSGQKVVQAQASHKLSVTTLPSGLYLIRTTDGRRFQKFHKQ
ncbi:MAG: T9SS type A sorting domain-containing protein [Bacteroidia bacterium]|nr:T9SS type A sorting domain-containing protein [Bacteroidia bacterium]